MLLFRYLSREVLHSLLATTSVLLVIFLCNQFIHYLGRAASGHLPVHLVVQIMSLQVPLLLGYILPLALYLGILLAYGRLYAESEMTVLFACGVSRGQLVRITLGFSAIIMLAVASLSLWIEPKMAWYRDHIYAQAASASPIEKMFPGHFESIHGGKWVVYVKKLSNDRKKMQGVFMAHMPVSPSHGTEQKAWDVVVSQGGHQKIDAKTGEHYVVLEDGYRYTGVPGKKDFQVTRYKDYGVQLKRHFGFNQKQAELQSTAKLLREGLHSSEAQAELQWRLAMPISVLVLALLAVPLSRVKPRQGRFAQLLPAILIYIVYADLIFVGQVWIEKGMVSSFFGMWWIHAAMLLLALVLFFWPSLKNRKWMQIKINEAT